MDTFAIPRPRTGALGAAPLRCVSRASLVAVAPVAGSLAAVGWLFELQRLGLAGVGPHVGDALPLLQLAGRDGQPLARIALACLPAGLAAGIVLSRLPRPERAGWVTVISALTLLLASQASYALARNVGLLHTLIARSPGAGAWVEASLIGMASVIAPRRT